MAIFSRKNFQQNESDYAKSSRYYVEDEVEVEEEESAPANNVGFGGVSLGGSSIELKVVRPEHFEDVSTIADHLLSGRTVVLNLEAASKETARRLLDFLSGIAYSIDGQMKRVANNTYIITPNNVDVSDSAMRGERGGADID
jgi:cell division inhibitor SepF